jgi:tetratricopeptide (TPR) repeat protein
MERRRFPGTLEMITGKFVRHSPEYYEWRIQDRTKRLRSPAEDPALADDLAVAYSKLGRHAEGIALLEQVLAADPDRYETLANLGTIHMLAGDLKVGKQYVDRAIAVNPDAHFGREKYQSLLAEYFLTKRKSPHPATGLGTFTLQSKGHPCGFAEFVLEKRGRGNRWIDEQSDDIEAIKTELAAAQKGVLGMMHFANYDSPLLLEALGDLLIAWPSRQDDALQLAARSYYRVAKLSNDRGAKDEFEMVAAHMLEGHLDYIHYWKENGEGPEAALEELAADLSRELADAQSYFNSIAADERRWIAKGVDVDKAFASKYYDSLDSTIEEANKQLATERRDVRGSPYDEAKKRALLFIGAIVAAFVAVVWGARFAYRRIRPRSDKFNDHSTE